MAVIPANATWVRFPRFVGDAVMHFPILRALRQKGIGPLVVWGPALTVNLLKDHELADAVLPDVGKPGPREMARILKQHQAARSIHFPKSLRPALGAWLARVPERIGVSESLAGPFNTHTLPFWKGEGTCLDRYMKVLALRWPDLGPAPFPDFHTDTQVDLPKQPYICLLPASTPARSWGAEAYARLAEILADHGYLAVVQGSPKERELGDQVAGARGLNACGASLLEATAWFQNAAAVVGNNSGLSHLAAACGTPTLCVFRSIDEEMFKPFGPKVALVSKPEHRCGPCRLDVCRTEGHPCLGSVTPEEAWAALQVLLQ
jgi:heptosyltransferase-2